MEQRIGQCARICEILRPFRDTGDRMIGRKATDRGAEFLQLPLSGTDPEQTAILLHHVNAGAAVFA